MAIRTIPRGEVPPGEKAHLLKFVCPPTFDGGPFDPQPRTVLVERKLMRNEKLQLPSRVRVKTGRRELPIWIIEDPDDSRNGRVFPSKTIRVRQDSVVHARVSASTNTHTIHWHGIEPSPINDGVGHTSFELTSRFVYQFSPHTTGTYFYHCHKNTVLHFEMGLYGLLIVDPPEGPGFTRANVPGVPGFDPARMLVRYDVEAFWVPDEMDSVWHELGHDAFMQACDDDDPLAPDTFTRDGFLNDFRPDVFLITGVVSDGSSIVDPRVQVRARVGQTILVRLLNAGYTIQEYTLPVDATVIGIDGHPLGVPPFGIYSQPYTIPAGTPFRLTSARRFDLLLRPTARGTFPAQFRYIDWIRGTAYHTASTSIVVQ